MIYFFSGTGNSKATAFMLGEKLQMECRSIPEADATQFKRGKKNIFVFPVYSWGVPPIVLDFIKKIPTAPPKSETYCVMTCGDETGNAPEMFRKAAAKKNLDVKACYSVIAPNTYVLLPGFDVDGKETERRKLLEMPERINWIASEISSGKSADDVIKGSFPRLKTRLVYPLFRRFGIFPKRWKADSRCISCGICARKCPVGNISMTSGKPSFGINCTSCLACYHNCPVKAISYGHITYKKGQYHYPD